jgi:hypothetical protein
MLPGLKNPFGPTPWRTQGEADVLNRMHQQIQALSMMRTGQGLDFNVSPFGATLSLNIPKPVFARIVDKTNVSATDNLTIYSALPVIESLENITAGSAPIGTDQANMSLMTAYELSNNRDVPADGSVYVWLYPPQVGNHWYFDYDQEIIFAEIECQEFDSGSGSGTGDDTIGVNDCSEGAGYGVGSGPGSAKYAWHQVIPQDSGLFADPSNVGYHGTLTVNPLYEINGNRTVLAGTIVRAWRGWTRGHAWAQIIPINRGNGTSVREKQRLFIHNACSGTFTLTVYDSGGTSATTTAIAYDATAAQIEAAIEALANITNVTVSVVSGTAFDIEFQDSFLAHKFIEPNYVNLESCQTWLFESAETSTSSTSYRYYCIGGALKEYEVTEGGMRYIRDVACCDATCEACTDACNQSLLATTVCTTLSPYGQNSCWPALIDNGTGVGSDLQFNSVKGADAAPPNSWPSADTWYGTRTFHGRADVSDPWTSIELKFWMTFDPDMGNGDGGNVCGSWLFHATTTGGVFGKTFSSLNGSLSCSSGVNGLLTCNAGADEGADVHVSLTEECAFESGSGPGSGSGSSCVVETDCCENDLPCALTATFGTATGGELACLDGDSVTLNHTSGQSWSSAAMGGGGNSLQFSMYCQSGVWKFQVHVTGSGGALGCTFATYAGGIYDGGGPCDPLSLSFSISDGSNQIFVSVTE